MTLSFPVFHRSCKGLVRVPSQYLNPTTKGFVSASYSPCPIFKTHRFSVVCNDNVSASISHLFCSCGPFAIVWRVSKLVVFAIYLVFFGGRRPHIVGKRLNRVYPCRMNFYSHCAISFKCWMVGIQTSLFHFLPAAVNFGSA